MAKLVALILVALVAAAPAAAQDAVQQAADALRADPVYVHPETDAVSEAEAEQLRLEIEESANGPLFIAILPADAASGNATEVATELGRLVRIPGVYAVVVGNQFRAVSTDLAEGQAAALATRSFLTNSDNGVAAVLTDFVRRVGDVRAGSAETQSEDGGGGFPTWLLAVGGAIAALFGIRALRRRREQSRELADVKAVAREDLVALAEDVVGLDEEVERHPEAKAAYLRAMEAYQRADDAFDRARSPRDLAKVTESLAESRYEMETAKALLAGEAPPERNPPCFFDPRHGTATQQLEWESPYGGPIQVWVCDADAARIRSGREPDVRQVAGRPIWDAPAYFQPWAIGFFGLAAGAAFVGSSVWAEDASAAPVDGGDFGGGDLGGGDFGGGGDWGGGGDFGGGGGDGGGF